MQHSEKIVQAAKMKRELLIKLLEIIMAYSRLTIMNDTETGFLNKIKSCFFDNGDIYHTFILGKIYRLEICNEYVFLWQDAKGQISYSFCIRDKEEFTTTAVKLGNALSSHFDGYSIEVANNYNEETKRRATAIAGLSKAILDSKKYDDYQAYSQSFNQPHIDNNTLQTQLDPIEQRYKYNVPSVGYNQAMHPYQQFNDPQKQLYNEAIQLNSNQLDYNYMTIFIYINQLPIVHKKNLFKPFERQIFFTNNRGLNCKNSYRPSEYMFVTLSSYTEQPSFILSFIYFMAYKSYQSAMNIFLWLVNSFWLRGKLGYALVLHSKNDTFMKLFYEEIIKPLFNADHCEHIDKVKYNKIGSNPFSLFHKVCTFQDTFDVKQL